MNKNGMDSGRERKERGKKFNPFKVVVVMPVDKFNHVFEVSTINLPLGVEI